MSRRRIFYIGMLLIAFVVASSLLVHAVVRKTPARAEARVKAFVEAINYDYKTPYAIYPYLTEKYREQMSESEFVAAFIKERSYPYLTPLFLNFTSLDMEEDGMRGVATFSQAARLPGMVVEMPLIFENGDYYIDYFEEFLDDSYLDKFNRLTDGGF